MGFTGRGRITELDLRITRVSCESDHAPDPRKAVQSGVETEDLRNFVLLHDRHVDCVASGKSPILQNNLFGAFDGCEFYGQYVIHDTKQRIEGRLDRMPMSQRDRSSKKSGQLFDWPRHLAKFSGRCDYFLSIAVPNSRVRLVVVLLPDFVAAAACAVASGP